MTITKEHEMISRKTEALQRKANQSSLLIMWPFFKDQIHFFSWINLWKFLNRYLIECKWAILLRSALMHPVFFHRPSFNDTRVPKGRKGSIHSKKQTICITDFHKNATISVYKVDPVTTRRTVWTRFGNVKTSLSKRGDELFKHVML